MNTNLLFNIIIVCIIDYNFFRQKIQGDFLNKYNFCFTKKLKRYFIT